MSFQLAERELGRALDRAQRHSVPTLNDITATMLEELRRLSPLAVDAYLRWHLHPGSETSFDGFTRDVIRGEMDPKTWGHRDILALVGEDRRGAALTMTADQVRNMVAGIEGERWRRLSLHDARQVNRDAGASGWGAPGVLVRLAPYWWTPPRKEVKDYIVSSSWMSNVVPSEVEVIPDANFVVAFRRWIACRVAWWAKARSIELSTASPRQLVDEIGTDINNVTSDGAAALSALIREAKLPFDPDQHVRGFVGPDEWYAAG